jgi:Kdo2-lipid IVA lauroyltransferase/acyltransferase
MKRSWPKAGEFFDAISVKLVRRLPLPLACWLGGEKGAIEGRRALKKADLSVTRLRDNIARFSGATDPAELDRRVIEFYRLMGRIYAEIPNMQRLYASGCVEMVGQEHLVTAGKPCIIVSAHIANWEMGLAVAHYSTGVSALFVPLRNAFQQSIVHAARVAWPDLEMIPTSPVATLKMDRALKKGRNVALLVDEIHRGFVRGPSLGRAMPYAGNRWIAAQLAVRNEINIVPAFVECLGLARYRVVVQSPLERPNGMGGETLARHFADQIDQRLEAWLRPRIETWFCLPSFDPEVSAPPNRRAEARG